MTDNERSSRRFAELVIAKDYYDGEISGIAIRAVDGALVYFRAVAWDDEEWNRIFAVAIVDHALGDRLRSELLKVEASPGAFWLPGSESNIPPIISAWGDISHAALRASTWQLVEGHDLFEAVVQVTLSKIDAEHVADLVFKETIMNVHVAPLLQNFLRKIQDKV